MYNVAYIMHTYCIYIFYLAAHCMLHTQYIHIACMQHTHKNWLSATRMPYKHMKKCMQFVCNCLHAACMLHITIAHMLHTCIQMCATSCACMWHACGAEPIFVYAAHMQYGCIVCAARMQRICTVCAARKQIYVQQGSRYMCSKEADICAARKQIYVQQGSRYMCSKEAAICAAHKQHFCKG